VWLFTLLAGLLLLVVNTKLVYVARFATRGGRIHRQRPGVFWLNRPWLLLPVVKARAAPPPASTLNILFAFQSYAQALWPMRAETRVG
jgi:hypothetical protein